MKHFSFNFSQTCLCYFSQNIMGTEQLPHILKQNTHTFWWRCRWGIFLALFSTDYLPHLVCSFFFNLKGICTRGIHKLDFHPFNHTATQKNFKNKFFKKARQNLRNLSREVSGTLLIIDFFSFTSICQRSTTLMALIDFSCFSNFYILLFLAWIVRQVSLVHLLRTR